MSERTVEKKVLGMDPDRGRWGFIAIGAIIFFFIGAIYSWSVFRGPVQKLFGCGATAAGAPYMLFFAVQAFLMPFLGPHIDRLNPGRVILASGMVMSAGLFLASYSRNIYEFTAAFSCVFGLGATAVYAAPIALAARWFPDRKGFAIGLTLFGMGLAPLVMAPLAVKLIAGFGVMATFRMLGAAVFIVVLALFSPVRFPADGYAPAGWPSPRAGARPEFTAAGPVGDECDRRSPVAAAVEGPTRGEMVRSRSFIVLWLCFMTASAGGLMVIGITHQVAVEMYSLGPAAAAFAISVFAFFNAAGRPAWGAIIDRTRPRTAAAVSFAIMGCASLAVASGAGGHAAVFFASVPLIWFCYGGWLSIAPSLTANFFGVKNASRNYGVVFTAFGAGAIAGNLLAGSVKDLYGGYGFAFHVMAAAAFAAMALSFFALEPPAGAPAASATAGGS